MAVVRVATRGSAQAQRQASLVAAALEAADSSVRAELVLVETSGDRHLEVPLHAIGGQGVFVKEVQRAVLDGAADVAVHSAKDLPSQPTEGLLLAAFTARRDPRDALVGKALADLARGATVATGAVRRREQLRLMRPDLTFVELRGNIHRRLSKVPPGGAIVIAAAALEVLQITDEAADVFPVETMVPAVGQGCVAVECRVADTETSAIIAALDDAPTRHAVTAERAFLAELGSGCSLPVGAHAARDVLHFFLADPSSGRHVIEQVPLPADAGAVHAAVQAAHWAMAVVGTDGADG